MCPFHSGGTLFATAILSLVDGIGQLTCFKERGSHIPRRGFVSEVHKRATAQKITGLKADSNTDPLKSKFYKVNAVPSELAVQAWDSIVMNKAI